MPSRTIAVSLLLSVLAAGAAAQATDREHLRQNVFAQMRWKELGPVLFGGRIVDVAVHPANPNVWWVASASGGLWRTRNNGGSFEPQFQDAYTTSIGDVAVAPSAPDTLYVGTGEANNQRSSYWGDGVYKSTDGGEHWQHVGLAGTEHIGRIAVHPANADVVYVAALGALYTPNHDRGLYRSKDGGKTWQCVKHLGDDVGFVDVAIDPKHPDTVYAASYERRRRAWNFVEGGLHSRLWKSTDGGDTWTQLAGGLPEGQIGRIGIDLFAGNPDILYATIENLNPQAPEPPAEPKTDNDPNGDEKKAPAPDAETLADPLAAAEWAAGPADDDGQEPVRAPRRRLVGGEVYRSNDAGATWHKTNTVPVGGSPAYYYGQIRVDPNDADTVYVLSVPVYRSTDGGKTWTPGGERGARGGPRDGARAAAAFQGNLHSDHHALWIDPRDSRHCILGNDGGLAVTWDTGRHWDHIDRLPIAQFYTVAVDMGSPYKVYGGLQDNGTWAFPIHASTSRGLLATDAVRINGGDGFCVACDPADPDVVYSESQFGGMSRLHQRTGERKSIKPRADKGSPALRFNWMTPIVLSPHAPHTVYVGSQYVHRSRDCGDTWTTISPDLTTNDPDKLAGDVPHCTITTIAESPRREGMLWVGTDDGRVWTSRDGGGRWQERTDRFPASVRGLWVARVEASPHAADTAFVAFTGYREDRREPLLFRTDDAGETFRSIANDLPQEPINVVRQHPRNEHVLLVGTERGVHVSIDDGASWYPLGGNLPHVPVHDLVVHPRERHVLVATHGRGIWALDGRAFEALDAETLSQPLAVLPPSDGILLPRSFSQGNVGVRTWSVENPFTAPTFRFCLAEDAAEKVRVEVLDAAGTVLFRHEADGKAGYQEVAWQAGRGFRGFDGGGAGGPAGGGERGGQGNPGAPGAGGPGPAQRPAGQGPGGAQGAPGQGFGGRGARGGRGGMGGPRPGQFAVRVTLGETSKTLPFEVRDLRGPRAALGGTPGLGGAGEGEVVEEELGEEELEAALEAGEGAGERAQERRGR